VSVLLPNASLGLRRRSAETYDDHGTPLPGALGAILGPFPGRLRERADGGWDIALDPALWPAGVNDLVVEDGTSRTWNVETAALLQNAADSTVDWIRVQALERKATSTEPGGPEFATR
jgi:hypothetical protein